MVELIKIAKYGVALCALAYIIIYIFLGINHILYPFEIEVTEGQALEQVRILLEGKQLYVEPSLEFTPFIYMPLYYYIAAFFAKFSGVNFATLRFISFAASLGCILLIYLITKRESRSIFAGIAAAGLYAATYEASGAWMDITRVDSLFLIFLLMSLYFLRFGTTRKSQFAAGIFLWLSFMTKQTAALIAIPLFAYAVIANKKRSLFFIGTTGILSVLSLLLLNYSSRGWFLVYFLLPFQHEVEQRFYLDFWRYDIAAVFIACVFAVYYLASRRWNIKKDFFFYAAAGMIAASWAARLHVGGWNNAMFPAYAIIAILCGLAIAKLLHDAPTNRKFAVYLLLFIQFALLFYNPLSYIPAAGSIEMGQSLMETIEQYPNPVFIPNHPYLLSRLGMQSHAHALTMWDFFRTKDKTLGGKLQAELTQALQEQRFSAIIIDNELFILNQPWFTDTLRKYYVRNTTLFENESGLWTVSGVKTRPSFIYVPNATAQS